jgi:hypothetical protein
MTPGTLVLLHGPMESAAVWGSLPETLRSYGLDVIAPDLPDAQGAGYVGRGALVIAATAPLPPLLLVAHGGAGLLLPLIAGAQRAAHRTVGGYVFMDAELPVTTEDWPDAPCGYLQISAAYDQEARQARLRGWVVAQPYQQPDQQPDLASTLHQLITVL